MHVSPKPGLVLKNFSWQYKQKHMILFEMTHANHDMIRRHLLQSTTWVVRLVGAICTTSRP